MVSEIASVTPIAGWMILGIIGTWWKVIAEIMQPLSIHLIVALLSDILVMIFAGFQITLFLVRPLPQVRSAGWQPRVAAIAGSNVQLLLLTIPRVSLSIGLALVSDMLMAIGTLSCIGVLSFLGRSFSIFPQARSLVVGGPYRFVRHPLYLAEQIAGMGLLLQFQQPWSLLVGLGSLALTVPRMHFEEKLLTETFPSYVRYASHTARLIPGVY
jgi:protein-S-isoprenylcysteine O-methyltransferase Ste14